MTTTLQEHTSDLVDEYTGELGLWLDSKVPPILLNGEYAARTSALLIALSRQIGRVAAAFGSAQNVDDEEVGKMCVAMFTKHQAEALLTIKATELATVQ